MSDTDASFNSLVASATGIGMPSSSQRSPSTVWPRGIADASRISVVAVVLVGPAVASATSASAA